MSEVGYAMLNEKAVESLVSRNSPFELLTWTHPVLECLLLLGSLAAFLHAWHHYRQHGEKWLLHAWLAIIVHAIFWEITVFNFEEHLATFWHGEFSIMLYHNRLPLYIVLGYYPALFYHALITVKRLNLKDGRYQGLIEALLVGLVFEIFYIACESVSPVTQWWQWNNQHAASQPVWMNIPANAYLWGLSYGFAYAWLSRYFFIELPQKKAQSAFKQGLNIILVGALIPLVAMLFMIPTNTLVYGFNATFAAGGVIFIYFALAAWILLGVEKRPNKTADWRAFIFPATWVSFLVAVHFYLYEILTADDRGASFTAFSSASGSLWLSLVGIVGSVWLIYIAFIRRDESAEHFAAEHKIYRP